MNHTVFQIDPADSRFTDTFARFFTNCGEYELFSDCDTPYFAVFSDIDRTHCTGLLTFLISENESFTEAEVAAFVLPDYRRQGIFTALCGTAYHKIKAQYPDCMLTGIFPDFLKKCALYGGTAYTEYLMMLTAEKASLAGPGSLHGCSGFMYYKWGHSAGFCCLFKHTLHDNQLTCKRFQFLQ